MRFGHIMQNFSHVPATDEARRLILQEKLIINGTKGSKIIKIPCFSSYWL